MRYAGMRHALRSGTISPRLSTSRAAVAPSDTCIRCIEILLPHRCPERTEVVAGAAQWLGWPLQGQRSHGTEYRMAYGFNERKRTDYNTDCFTLLSHTKHMTKAYMGAGTFALCLDIGGTVM